MDQAVLYGVRPDANGLQRNAGQAQILALIALSKKNPSIVPLTPDSIAMLSGLPRFEKKTYYVAGNVSGGVGVASDLMADLPSSEKIGVVNFNQKKIAPSEVFVCTRLEVVYATVADTVTTATNELIPTLNFKEVNDIRGNNNGAAPAGLVNGEIELTLTERRVVRLPLSQFVEPVAGTVDARAYGIELEMFPLIQNNDVIGVKIFTAAALPEGRHFVKVSLVGDAARSKV